MVYTSTFTINDAGEPRSIRTEGKMARIEIPKSVTLEAATRQFYEAAILNSIYYDVALLEWLYKQDHPMEHGLA